MTTRAGRAFKTLHDRIERLEGINKDLLDACKEALPSLQVITPNPWHDLALKKIQQVIAKAEGRGKGNGM